jgi:hypothetical protein
MDLEVKQSPAKTMMPQKFIFICDDGIQEPERTWIAAIVKELPKQGRDKNGVLCEYVARPLKAFAIGKPDGQAYIDDFFAQIRTQVLGHDFFVVSDATFGWVEEAGAKLLLKIAEDAELGCKFVRGLVYSIRPELGKSASNEKIRGLKKRDTPNGPTAQSPIILEYLTTGKLKEFQDLAGLCKEVVAFLNHWQGMDGDFIPDVWELSSSVLPVFERESAVLFQDLLDYQAKNRDLRLFVDSKSAIDSERISRLLCPFESLRHAAQITPDRQMADLKGGAIRLLYELSQRTSAERRLNALCKNQRPYGKYWIESHARRLQSNLDLWEGCLATHTPLLKRIVKRELDTLDAFLEDPFLAHYD